MLTSSFLFIEIFFYVYGCFDHMYVCVPCVYTAYRGQKMASEDGTRVIDSYEVLGVDGEI